MYNHGSLDKALNSMLSSFSVSHTESHLTSTMTRWPCELNPYQPSFLYYPSDEGISGDALPYLDPIALSDLGIDKMGHRLSICKAIYNLKVELTTAAAEADPEDGLVGWDWTEEDWRPAGESSVRRLAGVQQRDGR
jgi:hypothetical protein